MEHGELPCDRARDLDEGAGRGRIRGRKDRRVSLVPGAHDVGLHGNPSEKIHPELLRGSLAPALSEESVTRLAGGALEVAHVLDDPEDRNVDALEHLESLSGVDERDLLRGGHDHGSGEGSVLTDGQRGVTRSGREIEHEVVELSPVDVGQKLLDDPVHHRTAPDDGRVLSREKPDRHEAEPVGLLRDDLSVGRDLRLSPDAEHQGD